MKKILFVCLGNICRSPLAEAIFAHKMQQRGITHYKTDSCGTINYHVGDPPDYRSIHVAKKNGVPINHRGRQLQASDFDTFDYILVMDKNNLEDVTKHPANKNQVKIQLVREYDPKGNGIVPDPYYGDEWDFDNTFTILDRTLENLIDELFPTYTKTEL